MKVLKNIWIYLIIMTAVTAFGAKYFFDMQVVGNLLVDNQKELRLGELDSSGDNYLGLRSPALTANYTLTFPVNDGASGEVLSTDGSGGLSWAVGGGGGGDAWSDPVDSSIIPDTNNTYDLGSNSARFNESMIENVYTKNFNVYDSGWTTVKIKMENDQTTPSGVTSAASMRFPEDNDNAAIFSNNNSDGNAEPTNSLHIETGNKTSGTGDSGDINLQTGTSSGGDRGDVTFDGEKTDVQSGLLISSAGAVTGDPCGDSNAFPEGTIFYNDTSNYFCYCDGTNDVQLHSPATACF